MDIMADMTTQESENIDKGMTTQAHRITQSK